MPRSTKPSTRPWRRSRSTAAPCGRPGWRLLVQESVAEEVLERLGERLSALRHGDPLDPGTDVGPLISRARRDRLLDVTRSSAEEGASVVQAPWVPPERGFWFPATVVSGVQPAFRIAREGFFGPLLAVMTFRTPAEAIELANGTPAGLAAAVWTTDGALALYTAQRLAAGTIWCNTVGRSDPSAPSGGYNESGFGRAGGLAGLRAYLDT